MMLRHAIVKQKLKELFDFISTSHKKRKTFFVEEKKLFKEKKKIKS